MVWLIYARQYLRKTDRKMRESEEKGSSLSHIKKKPYPQKDKASFNIVRRNVILLLYDFLGVCALLHDKDTF